MVKKVFSFWDKAKETLLAIAITAILGLLFKLYIFITITYPTDQGRQEMTNQQLREAINVTRGWIAEVDSNNSEKNKATQSRINFVTDKQAQQEIVNKILIDYTKGAKIKLDEIFKYIKPANVDPKYTGILTENK